MPIPLTESCLINDIGATGVAKSVVAEWLPPIETTMSLATVVVTLAVEAVFDVVPDTSNTGLLTPLITKPCRIAASPDDVPL